MQAKTTPLATHHDFAQTKKEEKKMRKGREMLMVIRVRTCEIALGTI